MKIWQRFFSKVNFQVFAITHYDSLNLKKYCKKIFVVKDYNIQNIKENFLKIDPYKKMEIFLVQDLLKINENDLRSK